MSITYVRMYMYISYRVVCGTANQIAYFLHLRVNVGLLWQLRCGLPIPTTFIPAYGAVRDVKLL